MRVKLLLFSFYLNGGLHAVFIGKPSERMSNFCVVRFLKTEFQPNFGFLHIPKFYCWLQHLRLPLIGHFLHFLIFCRFLVFIIHHVD